MGSPQRLKPHLIASNFGTTEAGFSPGTLRQLDALAVKTSLVKYTFFALVYFVAMMGLWVLYTDTVKFYELLVGSGAALLATFATALVQQERFAEFAPDPKWLLYFAYMPWYALRDTVVVFRAAFKYMLKQKSDGYLVAVDYDPGGDDPRSGARRTLETVLTTIPPNSVVIGIDRHANKMLLHMLSPGEISWVTRRLGAKP